MAILRKVWSFIVAFLCLAALDPSYASDLHLGTIVQHVDATIGRDGVFVKREHSEITVQTAAAAASFTHFSLSWTGNQTLKIVDAFTRKADGSIIQTHPADFVIQNGLVGAAASFGDIKTEQLAFRDLAAGDTMVFDVVVTERSHYVPGAISEFRSFGPNNLDVSITYALTTPASLPISHSEHQFSYTKAIAGDHVTRTWKGKVFVPKGDETNIANQRTVFPNFGFSTLKSWQQLGEDYYKGTAAKLVVTPKVQALADKITLGITDPRKQATAIFNWAASHIHYVAVYFGTGRFVPNDLDTILSRRFGDCKDHALLMAALLKAKGIDSQFVLANILSRNAALPSAPILQAVNHVFLYVPSLDAWADPTAPYSEFGFLPSADRDAPVVRVGASGAEVVRTPNGTAAQNQLNLDTKIVLTGRGERTGETRISGTGRFGEVLRRFVAITEVQGQSVVLKATATTAGIGGTLKMTAPSSLDRTDPYAFTTSWHAVGAPAILRTGWRPPDGLSPLLARLPTFFSTLPADQAYPFACVHGVVHENVRATLPPHVNPIRLPPPVTLSVDGFTYSRTWAFKNDILVTTTEAGFNSKSKICQPAMLRAVVDAAKRMAGRFDPILRFERN